MQIFANGKRGFQSFVEFCVFNHAKNSTGKNLIIVPIERAYFYFTLFYRNIFRYVSFHLNLY